MTKVIKISSIIISIIVCLHLQGCSSNKLFRKEIVSSEHFIIYSDIDYAYTNSIKNILECSIGGYVEIFGIIPLIKKDKILVYIVINKNQEPSLSINPIKRPAEITFSIQDEMNLMPPNEGGLHHIYGFVHELGHYIMEFDNSDFNEGFAAYLAIEVVDYIAKKLGSDAWPKPYNYIQEDGTGRMEKISMNNAIKEKFVFDAILLWKISKKYGSSVISSAITETRKNNYLPTHFSFIAYPAKSFVNTLYRYCLDTEILDLLK